MDKIDKKIVFSLLFLVVIFFIAGIFIRNIESKKKPISFTPARSEISSDNNFVEDENEDKTLDEEPDNTQDDLEDLDSKAADEENIEGVIFTSIRAQMYATVNLNVRRGPGQQYDVVTSLSMGDEVTLIAKEIGRAHV